MCRKMLYILIIFFPLYGEEHPLFRAMRDELKRTIKRLKMEEKAPPYYVAYRVRDVKKVYIKGNFGAIVSNNYTEDRKLFIDLRVGDYEFDNTNFVAGPSGIIYWGDREADLPLEDDYDAIRHRIWLATDRAYKAALDNLSKKEAILEHRRIPDRPPDFSKIEPVKQFDKLAELKVNQEDWAEKIKALSEVFRKYPDIQTSEVIFSAEAVNQYFIDSDGSEHRRADLLTYIEAHATTQTKDGAKLSDFVGFYVRVPEELPPIDVMKSAIKGMAETLSVYTKLEKEKEEYTGPVLFLSQGAGEFFYQLLGKGLSDPRKPIYEHEMMAPPAEDGFLSGKVGSSILPDYFCVYADPTVTQFKDVPLIGSYTVDDQGVKARRVELVKDGKLIEPFMSRIPIKEIAKSNAHARDFGGRCAGRISNLFIESKKTIKDLEAELIKLCKEKDLNYGIVVVKLTTLTDAPLEELIEEIIASFLGGEGRKKPLLSAPLVMYKLYTDGRKELVRGLEFADVTTRALKDIVAVSEDQFVYNSVMRAPLGGIFSGGSFVRVEFKIGDEPLPFSIIGPAIIVDELTLTPKEERLKELPLIKHPAFE